MSPSDGEFGRVTLSGATVATEVSLIDSNFKVRADALRSLSVTVPAGIYKARFQLGSEIDDVRFELRPGEEKRISDSRFVGDRVGRAASPGELDLPSELATQAHEGEVVVVALLRRAHELLGDARLEVRSPDAPEPRSRHFRFPVDQARLRAGTHVLALTGNGETLCRAFPIFGGQTTLIRINVDRLESESWNLGSLLESLLLEQSEKGEDPLLQEMAQQALERSHALLRPADVISISSPLTKLLGAHGLIQARRARMPDPRDLPRLTPEEMDAVRTAYDQLRITHLGESADVAALGLIAGQSPPPVNLDIPPLLACTWQILSSISLTHPEAVHGGEAALRIAEGLIPSSLWLVWAERAPSAASDRGLKVAARDHLEPVLRPQPGRLPSWVTAPEDHEAIEKRANALARGLQVPLPLVMRLAQKLKEERASTRERRARRRIKALSIGEAMVCLVALPDGVRVDPVRGQPIDFDSVLNELVDGAAAEAGLVAVQAPPLRVDSGEMRDALAQADVLLADVTYSDPAVMAAVDAWRERDPAGSRLVRIRAEGRPAPEEHAPLAYAATFGTGLSFLNPDEIRQALAGAAAATKPNRSPRRRSWHRKLAVAERLRLGLHGGRSPSGHELRRAHASVQLEVFLRAREKGDWRRMLDTAGAMAPALRSTVLVREQLALALKWSKEPANEEEAVRLLESVIQEIGPNGETCGLLGGVCKSRWLREKEPARLEEAIRWYREGLRASPQDPYPGVNLLTLLAVKGAPDALEEHARVLPRVEMAATRRLYRRPTYWDLVTMMEVAAHKRDQRACDWYLRLALAAPHDGWQRDTAVANLRILLKVRALRFETMVRWMSEMIDAFSRH